MDMSEVEARIVRFIKDYVEKTGTNGVVLGLSGGIDSCTVAALSAEALGGNKVLALMLPERETAPDSLSGGLTSRYNRSTSQIL
jgi:NAD+ synthetase